MDINFQLYNVLGLNHVHIVYVAQYNNRGIVFPPCLLIRNVKLFKEFMDHQCNHYCSV